MSSPDTPAGGWLGGSAWPAWPEIDRRTAQSVGAGLLAGRFAVSGPRTPWEPRLTRAAQAVAGLLGRRHAVLTPSGSSALVIALQALGVGPGDGVLVPAVTWIACATAVMRVGARPIYVDSSPGSPMVDGAALAAALARAEAHGWPVRCWMAVHLYAERLDVAGLRRRLPAGVAVLEDGSHSHGARHLDGRPVGSDGDLAIFSLQTTKPLTAGEGGAVVTDDPDMAERLFALGTDGRRWAGPEETRPGACPLVPAGGQHGAHHSMPELSAALLLDQAERFADQCRRRARGLAAFRDGLGGLDGGGATLLAHPAAFDDGAFYGVAVDLGREGDPGDDLFARLHGTTGVLAEPLYPPVPMAGHYQPDTIPGYGALGDDRPDLPAAEGWRRRTLLLNHRHFLAEPVRLHALGRCLRDGRAEPERRARPTLRRPGAETGMGAEVSVVVLTRGDRPEVLRAIESVAAQSAPVATEILVVIDGDGPRADELAADPRVRTVQIRAGDTLGTDTAGRVAALRNLALPLTRAPLVTFLDDDNRWRHDHLETLLAQRQATGCPAVHCWRTAVDRTGEPVVLDTFPWSDDPVLERCQRDACRALGLLDGETPTIRDAVSALHGGHDYGMVDMGAWLFDRRLLELVAFETRFDDEDRRWGHTEDDKLLAAFRRLAVPTSCTRRATLFYTVGGYSNPSES